MRTSSLAALSLLALAAFALPASAAQTETELALIQQTSDVTLLNDGGKYVAIDLKHIEKGEKCRIDEDAVVMRVGEGAAKDTIRVRTLLPQLSSGGCPLMTEYEMPAEQYATAHKAFADKKAEADKKLSDISRKLGEKWDELFGTAKPKPKTESL